MRGARTGRDVPLYEEAGYEGRGGRRPAGEPVPVRQNLIGESGVSGPSPGSFEAEASLVRMAPIFGPERRVPEGAVESAITITFEAVLLDAKASEEGDK